MRNLINELYAKKAAKFQNIVPILVTETSGKQYELPLEYRPTFMDWSFKQS